MNVKSRIIEHLSQINGRMRDTVISNKSFSSYLDDVFGIRVKIHLVSGMTITLSNNLVRCYEKQSAQFDKVFVIDDSVRIQQTLDNDECHIFTILLDSIAAVEEYAVMSDRNELIRVIKESENKSE